MSEANRARKINYSMFLHPRPNNKLLKKQALPEENACFSNILTENYSFSATINVVSANLVE